MLTLYLKFDPQHHIRTFEHHQQLFLSTEPRVSHQNAGQDNKLNKNKIKSSSIHLIYGGVTASSTQRLLLTLYSRISPSGFRDGAHMHSYGMQSKKTPGWPYARQATSPLYYCFDPHSSNLYLIYTSLNLALVNFIALICTYNIYFYLFIK